MLFYIFLDCLSGVSFSLRFGRQPSSQILSILQGNLNDFYCIVIWIISILPPIFNSLNPFSSPWNNWNISSSCFTAFLLLWQDLVFWLISTTLSSERSRFFLFQTVPILFQIFCKPFQVHQPSRSPTRFTVCFLLCLFCFLVLWQGPSICLYFHFLLFSLSGPQELESPLDNKFSIFW